MSEWFADIKAEFILNFIDGDRWKNITGGLLNTILITIVAAVIGVVLGMIVAAIRTTYDKNKESLARSNKVVYVIMSFLNAVCKIYLAIFRGTPVVVQLLIMFFIVFASATNGVGVAMLAFGINSGAYVAEIFRGGIMSIDNGQFEAGRSLGFNYIQTMMIIVMPQVIKSILPTLLNEFIALLKETSVAGYVGITDLTRGGNIIRGVTFSPFMPLIAVALIYLIMVLLLTYLVGRIERRLKKNER
ncbi:MAG: amino acid ABC transporter permease [Clostridiales bacterium]|nr:amino acid ABC transporter permease [Clostridiales bacterium]